MSKFFYIPFTLILIFTCSKTTSENKKVSDGHYEYIEQLGRQIDYSLLNTNESQNEIRIWIDETLLKGIKYRIKIKEFHSQTHIQHSVVFITEQEKNIILDSIETKNEILPIPLSEIFKDLKELHFDKTYSQPDSIKELLADGTIFIVETKQNGKYKSINCNHPEIFTDINSMRLTKIINYLSAKTDFQYKKVKQTLPNKV